MSSSGRRQCHDSWHGQSTLSASAILEIDISIATGERQKVQHFPSDGQKGSLHSGLVGELGRAWELGRIAEQLTAVRTMGSSEAGRAAAEAAVGRAAAFLETPAAHLSQDHLLTLGAGLQVGCRCRPPPAAPPRHPEVAFGGGAQRWRCLKGDLMSWLPHGSSLPTAAAVSSRQQLVCCCSVPGCNAARALGRNWPAPLAATCSPRLNPVPRPSQAVV